MTTTYIISANGAEVGTRTEKAAAIKLAEKVAQASKTAVAVTTIAGYEVFALAMPAAPVLKKARAKRWTRTEALPDGAVIPADTTPAYVRSRIGVAVFRKDDLTGYVVASYVTGEPVAEVGTTKEACKITDQLAIDAKAAKAAKAE